MLGELARAKWTTTVSVDIALITEKLESIIEQFNIQIQIIIKQA